jgi:hypothetical protein
LWEFYLLANEDPVGRELGLHGLELRVEVDARPAQVRIRRVAFAQVPYPADIVRHHLVELMEEVVAVFVCKGGQVNLLVSPR